MNPAHTSRDYAHCMKTALGDCHSVLELGCQFGSQLRLVDRPVMVGVEIHKPYLTHAKTVKDPRITYVQEDARHYMDTAPPKSFDAIMMIDFIEHLEMADALRVIQRAEDVARKKVWMWVPQGNHPQDYDEWELGGDHWQTHRSVWEPYLLSALGYDVAFWSDHHTPTNRKGIVRSRGAMFAIKEVMGASV